MSDEYSESTLYYVVRKELGLTREKACEKLDTISVDRLERIENQKAYPSPEEVMEMANKYCEPNIRNYYCAHQCPMGQCYVPEVRFADLSQTVLQMVSALNHLQAKKDILVDIAADGVISPNEIEDFIEIQDELEKISMTVDSLQLWVEKMLVNGFIDIGVYNELKNK